MNWKIQTIVAALVAAFLFGLGWVVKGWKVGTALQRKESEIAQLKERHAVELGNLATDARKVADLVRNAVQLNTVALAAVDSQLTGEMSNEKKDNDRMRGCIAAGTCGVRIITRRAACAAAGTNDSGRGLDAAASSVGDAGIGLDAETGIRVLDLRSSIQLDDKKLRYLQAYAAQCAGLEAQNQELNLHPR